MIDINEIERLLNKWREKKDAFANNAEAFKTTGYYGRMAESERDVAEQIVKDLETLLLKANK
jgi:hypothetical protein